MTKTDIERLPALVSEGVLTKSEAADAIWEDIYVQAWKYGLNLLDEDDKSDFLLYLRDRLEHIFDNYKTGRAHFKTFIQGLIRHSYLSWIRKRMNQDVEESVARYSLKSQYESELHKYRQQEDVHEEEECSAFKKVYTQKKERRLAEKVALILTLKSCYEIDETILENVSKFINIKKELLQELIDKLKRKNDYKAVQREQIIRRRDNAFYYHRKYLLELHKLQKGTSTFEKVQRKYQLQTKSWLRQNKLLSHRFVLSPTNVSIADELGIEPRKVSFYISHAVRRKNPFTIDEEAEESTDEQKPSE